MEESLIYANVANELLEIFKYMDKELKDKIPIKVIENLERITNKAHKFQIDKSKVLYEQKTLPQTKQILSIIYLKYCCTPQEANNIIEENYARKQKEEEKKCEKYDSNNIFKSKEEKVSNEQVQLIKIEDIPWHKKIIGKINDFLKKIFRK